MTIKNIHGANDEPYYAATVILNGIKHVAFGSSIRAVFTEVDALCQQKSNG